MSITPTIFINDGELVVHGKTILKEVPQNIVLTAWSGAGLVAAACGCIHRGHRFIFCFGFKLWWMTQRMGSCGKDVPLETQFMIVERKVTCEGESETHTIYMSFCHFFKASFVLFFRVTTRMNLRFASRVEMMLLKPIMGIFLSVHDGINPFEVINQGVKAVEIHLQTFYHREKKKLPAFLDWFGWCTWDAFYTDVTAHGVKDGLNSFLDGGISPRFLIIDDGWQQVGTDNKDNNCIVQEGAQFASRLTGIKENEKFQNKEKADNQPPGLQLLVQDAKKRHNVKFVHTWHAITKYWGGVKPNGVGLEYYDSAMVFPVQSPGVLGNQPDIVMDSLSVQGLGLVHPEKIYNFFLSSIMWSRWSESGCLDHYRNTRCWSWGKSFPYTQLYSDT